MSQSKGLCVLEKARVKSKGADCPVAVAALAGKAP